MFWALLLVAAFVGGASSDCCHAACQFTSSFLPLNVCADCSQGTPYCAYGQCNAFGCNCDNGCRQGNCQAQEPCMTQLGNFMSQHNQG
uniref:Uncharacterized protein n=1 Tax=Romanomermis culicivorax TaxID=13658 RepID=A0A915HM82_ROMCU